MDYLKRWRSVILRRASYFALVPAALGMVGAIAAFLFSSHFYQERALNFQLTSEDIHTLTERESEQLKHEEEQINALNNTSKAILETLEQVKHQGKSLTITVLDPADRQGINELKSSEAKLDARLSSLENALLTSPEKAVALPMMRQELDDLQGRTHSDIDGIRGEIGRLFALTQWFIGLMFTLALGLFGISISLQRAATAPKENQ
jgi:hypothetical protein